MKSLQGCNIPNLQSPDDDLSSAQRVLKEAVEQERVGLDGLRAVRMQLIKVFGRIERCAEKIDEEFAGRPFLPNVMANAPANTRRFNAYLARHGQVMRMLERAIELWSLTCGLKWEDDWVPLLIVEAQLGAAAKATQSSGGAAAKESRLSVVADPTAGRNRVG